MIKPKRRARVVFIGPMGSGKTRLGRRVAKRLGADFTDTDQLVVAEYGPIAELFAERGEAVFRDLERAAVCTALDLGGVVSLGGGAVLHPETRAQLERELVVLLTVTPEAVAARIADGRRPLLSGGIGDWQRIAAERSPIYEALADRTIDTSATAFDELADEVTSWVRQQEDPR